MRSCAQKHNPELVDTLFRLIFDVLWVAPYDRRRGKEALSEFEDSARKAAGLLAATDLATAPAEELQALCEAVERLVSCIERLESERLFSRWQCAEAVAQVRLIAGIVQSGPAVTVE